jgi:hypothetical protein
VAWAHETGGYTGLKHNFAMSDTFFAELDISRPDHKSPPAARWCFPATPGGC